MKHPSITPPFDRDANYDVILVGGGLACGLAALRLKALRPRLRFCLVEKESRLGGSHTWSFHTTDVRPTEFQWLKPLLARSWSRHAVRFPGHARLLTGGYHSIRSETFHEVVVGACAREVRLGATVERVTPGEVLLADGTTLAASVVIDGRGFLEPEPDRVGYQKFFGLDLRLKKPHGLTYPVLMDARCEQREGYRFFYLLPWSDTRVLVEDTRYADTPGIDPGECREEILRYVRAQGWEVDAVEREESGALPIPLATGFSRSGTPRQAADDAGIPSIGVRAGLFHPTTGYSLPDAVRAADALAKLPVMEIAAVHRLLGELTDSAQRSRWFFRFLNRMLFQGAVPERRFRILEEFYRLPEPLVHRFYAAALTKTDVARILLRRPPIPLLAAAKCFADLPNPRVGALREELFHSLTPQEVAR